MAIYTQKWGGGGGGAWVEKNRKVNNRGGDDYSGLESNGIEILSFLGPKIWDIVPRELK